MRLIFLGAPGAGKGTQADIIAKQWQIPHISTGEILRQAISGKTSLGTQAHVYVEAGELVPDILIMAIIGERFEQPDLKRGWILDGFPRNLSQAEALEQLLQSLKQPSPQVINFQVSIEVLVERMLARGRLDDNENTICRRLQVYQQETEPVIDFYQQRGRLITIDGNLSVAEVTSFLARSLEPLKTA
jgi:adenylate kinase